MSRPWMPLYVADYLADTGHLSTLEHGAYMLLIMHYWQKGSLPNNDRQLASIARASLEQWSDIRETIAEFFGSGWRHERIEAELEKAAEKYEKRANAGRAGGKAKAAASSNARAMPENDASNALPTTTTTTLREEPNGSLSETSSDTRKKRKDYPEAFESAWLSYPRDPNMSKAEAFDAWKKLDAADKDALAASIPAFVAYCRANPDYRPIHMCRYIAKRRFDGHGQPQASTPIDETTWRSRMKLARAQSTWSTPEWGPRPGESGCLVPKQLLEPGDGLDWREWEKAA
jgi:uncharacterized protein YdaU (DUF1376 family)